MAKHQLSYDDRLIQVVEVLQHIFLRRDKHESSGAPSLSTPSQDLKSLVREYNGKVLQVFKNYVQNVASERTPEDICLPLEHAAHVWPIGTPSDHGDISSLVRILSRTKLPVLAVSPFVALSGISDANV